MSQSRAQVMSGVESLTPLLSVDKLAPTQLFQSSLWGSEKCQHDIEKISEGLANLEVWSYQFLDASTKIPTGILTGNFVDLGNFDECLQINFPNSSTRGQHCLATISLNKNNLTADNSLQNIPNFLWSYCIPSSCSSSDLQQILNQTWSPLTGGSVTVAPADCQISGEQDWSAVDIFSVSLCAVFLLLCIVSTIFDTWNTRRSSNNLLRSFSLLLNGKRLLEVGKSSDAMRPLNGLRFLSISWVILGHRYFFMTTSPIMNLLDVSRTMEDINFQLIAGAVLAVDTFFLLSGLLNAYYLLKVLDNTHKFPFFKYYFHRYIRTTPALAIMVLIYATWYVRIGNGPIWNKTVDPGQQLCVDNWWPTLLYISNYYNPVTQCAGQSWYLAVDMQLYWITPLVILPCWKWPKISKYYLGFLLMLSTAIQFSIAYIDKIRMPFTISQDLEEYRRVTTDIYVPTHTRATPYIIGIMLGMLLYKLRKSNSNLNVTTGLVAAGWLLSTVFCLTAILGNFPFMQSESDHPYDRLESSFFISLQRIAWGAGISWIIVACLHGYGGIVNSILSWNGFVPLGRLTYSMFLTHMAVQQYQLGSLRTTGYYKDFDQIHRFFGDLLMAIITSTLLCLMFESPVMMVEKYFQQPRRKKLNDDGKTNEAYIKDAEEKI